MKWIRFLFLISSFSIFTAKAFPSGASETEGFSTTIVEEAEPAEILSHNKLVPKLPSQGVQFGKSLSVSGSTAIVGSPGEDNSSGAAYVFVRQGRHWVQQARLLATNPKADDYFGFSVSVHGNKAVVGVPRDDVSTHPDAGSIYIFSRLGNVWVKEAHLKSPEMQRTELFGTSVSIYGNRIVVGSILSPPGLESSGAAYVFVRKAEGWVFQQKLVSTDLKPYDHFGLSVDISGTTVIAGAPGADWAGKSNPGAAYVFVEKNGAWKQQYKLIASDGSKDDFMGSSVAVSGNFAVAGAHGDDTHSENAGSATVFARQGPIWKQRAQVTAHDGAANDQFGHSVDMSGRQILVGAPQHDLDSTLNAGAAYLFNPYRDIWRLSRKFVADDREANDQFGSAVGLSGPNALVGSPFDGGGSVYSF